MKVFTMDDLRQLGVCAAGINRAEAFGGSIENSVDGWTAYITAYPTAWTAPVFTAQALHTSRRMKAPDLVWAIARMGFKNAGIAVLLPFAAILSPANWRLARYSAQVLHGSESAILSSMVLSAADTECSRVNHAAEDAANVAGYVAMVTPVEKRAETRHAIVTMAVDAMAQLNKE